MTTPTPPYAPADHIPSNVAAADREALLSRIGFAYQWYKAIFMVGDGELAETMNAVNRTAAERRVLVEYLAEYTGMDLDDPLVRGHLGNAIDQALAALHQGQGMIGVDQTLFIDQD